MDLLRSERCDLGRPRGWIGAIRDLERRVPLTDEDERKNKATQPYTVCQEDKQMH
jgi:hypothetical protein